MIENTDSREEKIAYLKSWGADNQCYLELEGSVGFGRDCVGMVKDGHFPHYGFPEEAGNYESKWIVTEEAEPPEGVTDAYHKVECLAVLGHGDEALDQLYIWVKSLDANDVVVETVKRSPGHIVDALFNGLVEPHLVRRTI